MRDDAYYGFDVIEKCITLDQCCNIIHKSESNLWSIVEGQNLLRLLPSYPLFFPCLQMYI